MNLPHSAPLSTFDKALEKIEEFNKQRLPSIIAKKAAERELERKAWMDAYNRRKLSIMQANVGESI